MTEVKLNRHISDFTENISFEFECKNLLYIGGFDVTDRTIIEETIDFDYQTGTYTNKYANDCFNEIKSELQYIDIIDWTFGGRSNGWFILLSNDDLDIDIDIYGNIIDTDYGTLDLILSDIYTMESIVDKYKKNYNSYMNNIINNNLELIK